MNQHDQMREALRRIVEARNAAQHKPMASPEITRLWMRINEAEQALAAEPAPLVRLTLRQKAEVLRKVASELEDSLAFNMGHGHRVADAIQDAMERVNRRQLDQTPKTPSE